MAAPGYTAEEHAAAVSLHSLGGVEDELTDVVGSSESSPA